jgi:exosortase
MSNEQVEVNETPRAARLPYLLGLFLLVCLLPFAVAWDFVRNLIPLVLANDTFSQIPLIPLVSAFLLYEKRKTIFSEVSTAWALAAALMAPGVVCLLLARLNVWQLSSMSASSLFLFGVVLLWIGAFALFFGARAFRAALFPLLFLVFMIPIPEPFLSKLIFFLQKESASAAEAFFAVARVPYLREGMVFLLPGIRIRVAEECSGIRSTLAIFITTVLVCHIFLRSAWRKLVLCAVVVPFSVLKNGLRIMALSTLAVYVDPAFLRGSLHHYGGIVFFIFALLPMLLLLLFFERSERRASAAAATS